MKKRIIVGLLALGALMGVDFSKAMEAPEVLPFMYNGTLITLVFGNIEEQKFIRAKKAKAAIVNAAKSTLNGGDGVDGAIHKAAGQGGHGRKGACLVCGEFKDQYCEVGEAKLGKCHKINDPEGYGTNLYGIDNIIHAVGPDCSNLKQVTALQKGQLANAYYNSLKCAVNAGITNIAFPQISVGIYEFPHDEAVKIVVDTIKEFIDNHKGKIQEIRLVMYRDKIGLAGYNKYKSLLEKLERKNKPAHSSNSWRPIVKKTNSFSFFQQYKTPVILGGFGLGIIAAVFIASMFSK